MKNIVENKPTTMEEALLDPSYADVHEDLRYVLHTVLKTPYKDRMPQHYEKSMTSLTLERAVELFENQPNMPIKAVLNTLWQYLPEDTSASLVLNITKKVIEKWESLIIEKPLSTAFQQENRLLETA